MYSAAQNLLQKNYSFKVSFLIFLIAVYFTLIYFFAVHLTAVLLTQVYINILKLAGVQIIELH